MMEYRLYNEILDNGLKQIRGYREYIDNWIDSKNDYRMGISLLIRPNNKIKDEIKKVLTKIKRIEPYQYYYNIRDIHVTLFDLISAKQNFNYTNKQVNIFKEITKKALTNIKKFEIKFDGIILSDGAIIVKGYYAKEMEDIRQKLRKEIIRHNLKIDERYTTRSCHMTIARFRRSIYRREELIKFINMNNRYYFGEMKVSEIELVYHNWYDSKKEILYKYNID